MNKQAKVLIGVLFLILVSAILIGVFIASAGEPSDLQKAGTPCAKGERRCQDSAAWCKWQGCIWDSDVRKYVWQEPQEYDHDDYPDWSCDWTYVICAKGGELKPKSTPIPTPTANPTPTPVI